MNRLEESLEDENLNSYDEAKRMLNIIREGSQKQRLSGKSLITEVTSPDRIELPPDQLKGEEKKFREIISPRVTFNKFIIYPKSGNAEWSGQFQDNRIQWFYSLDDTRGVYISNELLRLDDSTLGTIKKLVGFYENWANEWANKIADEYINISDQTNNQSEESTGIPDEDETETGMGL